MILYASINGYGKCQNRRHDIEIRGKQVMLDSDLAKLYNCQNGAKTINQAVKRHLNRFPERYMFQLTRNEYRILRSQFGTLELKQGEYNVEILHSRHFHDRFIILDDKILYHCGASFKDLGKKCFAIARIEDKNILIHLLDEIKVSI